MKKIKVIYIKTGEVLTVETIDYKQKTIEVEEYGDLFGFSDFNMVDLQDSKDFDITFLQENEQLFRYEWKENLFRYGQNKVTGLDGLAKIDKYIHRGFALRLGDGKIKVFNNHLAYTNYKTNSGKWANVRSKVHPDLCEIVGAVMRKTLF